MSRDIFESVLPDLTHLPCIHHVSKKSPARALDLAQYTFDFCMRTLLWEHNKMYINSRGLQEAWQGQGRVPELSFGAGHGHTGTPWTWI